MKQIEEFEQRLERLIDEFSSVPYEDIADSLEYYSEKCKRLHSDASD